MIEFFQGIAGFIETVVNFVITLFQNLIFVITSVPKALVAITSVLAYFPSFITVPILAIISISIILAIINHWG